MIRQQRHLPKVRNRQTVARTRLFNIEQIDLHFANGVEVQYERMCGSGQGAVLVVPLMDDDTVMLISEYAAGVERYELALPKGRIEKGEDMLAAANREIMEEIGYGAKQLTHLTSFSIAPGYLSHITHVIVAQNLYERRLPGDEPEAIEVVPWQLSNLDALLAREDCTEARSIAALYMVRDKLKNQADTP